MTSNDREDPLRAALDALPREISPARDLWPGIAANLAAAGRRSAYARWSIAAALLIALAAAIGTTLRGRIPPEPVAAREPATQADESPYFADRERYAETAVRNSTRLAPETQAVLLDNLHIIETSMSTIQQRLDREPNNLQLRRLLFRLYEDEAAVLNAAQRVQLQATARAIL